MSMPWVFNLYLQHVHSPAMQFRLPFAANGRLYLCRSAAICVTLRLIADQQRQQSQPLPDHVDLTQAVCSLP